MSPSTDSVNQETLQNQERQTDQLDMNGYILSLPDLPATQP